MTGFCQELVQQNVFTFRLSFMIACHTDFNVDCLTISYNKLDVFDSDYLVAVVGLHAHVAKGESNLVQSYLVFIVCTIL